MTFLLPTGAFGLVSAGLFGLLVGSFVNVLVHRLPRDESVVSPASHCPACGAPIRPRDNIPVLSWILLAGRCRTCRAPIPARYPALELANAVLWVLVAWRARQWPEFAGGVWLASSCLALAVIDAEFQILPNEITLTGLGAGIALSFFSGTPTLLSSLAGALLGGGGLFLVAFLYQKIAGHEGMGLGDVKMLAMVGAFLGPSGVLVTVLLASLSGSVVGLALLATGRGDRKMRLPFGVFLAVGAVAALFFGSFLLERYRSLWP
ncbi:MAG: prepilin peptidase [Thermoanaerobaculia bacterium]